MFRALPCFSLAVILSIAQIPGIRAELPRQAPVEPANPFKSTEVVYQFAPLQALLAGVYEGTLPVGQLLEMGDLGMGTINPLDGEMIIVDGVAYRAALDGTLNELAPETLTPFAQIKKFTVDTRLELPEITSYEQLGQLLDERLPSRNAIYAIRIDGKFSYLKTRSVPGQVKPFRPLPEIMNTQQVHEAEGVEGTMVIFKFPAYLSGANVAGYHIHYVNAERTRGGHVLDLRAAAGSVAQVDRAEMLSLLVPRDPNFDGANLEPGGGAAGNRVLRGR